MAESTVCRLFLANGLQTAFCIRYFCLMAFLAEFGKL